MSRFSIQTVWKAKDRLTAPVTKMQNRIGKFARSVEKNLTRANRVATKFLGTLGKSLKKGFKAASVGAAGVAAALGLITREFMKIENAEASFTPMLGSVEKAKNAIKTLNELAAQTPFELTDLTSVASKLFPMIGDNMPKMVKTIRMLGDLAGGSGERLQSIATAFTRMMMKGRTEMMELNMLNDRNVPIFKELQKVLGVNARTFFKLSAAGRITSDNVLKAFKNMTGEGGMFHNAMDIASKTTSGLLARMRENISMTAAALGEILNPTIKDLINLVTKTAEKIRTWLEVTENKQMVIKHFNEFVEGAKKAIKGLYEQIKNKGEAVQAFEKLKKVMSILADGIIWLGEHGKTIAMVTAGFVGLAVAIKGVALVAAGIAAVASAPISVLVAGFTAVLAIIAKIASKSEKVKEIYNKIKGGVTDKIEGVKEGFKKTFGIGRGPSYSSKNSRMGSRSRVTGSNVRALESIRESRSLEKTEVTIKDETGRAEVTKGGDSSGFRLAASGEFG